MREMNGKGVVDLDFNEWFEIGKRKKVRAEEKLPSLVQLNRDLLATILFLILIAQTRLTIR